MPEILKSALLGLIQGLAEFLPISSSGHLVIFAKILNFQESGIAFEVFVHLGTLLSVLVAFRADIANMLMAPYRVWIKKLDDPETRLYLLWDYYIIIASLPAAVIGILFKDPIERLFDNLLLVFLMLVITALLMITAQFLSNRHNEFSPMRSFLVGLAQAFAILPGISRSGSTIFTGLALGVDREQAARFSFLMSVPVIFGAVILKLNDLLASPPSSQEVTNLAIGTLVAFVSGYLAILWLLDVVKKGKLQWFGYYCLMIAGSGLVWYLTQ